MANGKFSRPRRPEDEATQPLPPLPENEEFLPVDFDIPEDMLLLDPLFSDDGGELTEEMPLSPEEPAFPEPEMPLPPVEELPVEDEEPLYDEPIYDEPYRAPKKKRHRTSRTVMVLVGICIALLIVLAGAIGFLLFRAAADPYDNRILNNVTVAGIHVGGMTRAEAEEVVKNTLSHRYTDTAMEVILPNETLFLSPLDTGARLDVSAAVRDAFNYGRVGTDAEKEAAYNMSLSTNHTIGLLPYLNLDEDFIRGELELYASQYGSTLSQSTYKLEGDMPALDAENFDSEAPCQTLVITMGTPGLGLDIDQLFNDILDAYSFNRFQVEIKEISPDALPAELDLDAIYEEFYIAPVNAGVDMQKYEPIPGTYGYGFDLDQARELLEDAEYGQTVKIPMAYIEPEIMEDEVFFRDVLGECQTPHNTNEKRNVNLAIACAALDGMVLNPGDEFSFNDALGERTAEKGYQAAPTYSGVKVVDSLGGGICQVSSTLYWCTLLSDLEIVSRINHGLPVTYMDLGLDATVSWGYPDYQFRNNTNFPIKIHAEVSDGYVKMQILGTDERDYYVVMEAQIVSVEYPETVYEEHGPDEGYYEGEVIQSPSIGYIARSYKIKYNKETGEEISKDFEARSQYKKVDKVVVKIVDPDAPSEETKPSEESKPTETKPAETQPAETKPAETKPAETQPPETTPPATEPPAPTEVTTPPPPAENTTTDDEL